MKITLWTSIACVVVLSCFLIFRTGSGCEYVPVQGLVTAKQWVPAHDDMQLMNIYNADGTFTTIPYWVHYDDQYWIHVGHKKCRVSKEDFKKIEVQQYFMERIK